MNASELRIGNLIMLGDIMASVSIIEQFQGTNAINEVNQDMIKPISLTEDWLIKFGLTEREGKRKGIYYKGKFEIDIHMMHISFEYNRILNKTAENYRVHEFQNLYFALTGKELTPNSKTKPNGRTSKGTC